MKQQHFEISKLSKIMDFTSYNILECTYFDYNAKRYPTVKRSYLTPLKDIVSGKRVSNTLTNCVVKYLIWNGCQAERINTMGVYRNGRWTTSGSTPGSSDISAIINGRSVKIEIKIKDKQSEVQKKYQLSVETAGGEYWLVKSFDGFLNRITDFNNNMSTNVL
jgi:hypothetical protein